jgi:hypothetical protein
VSRTPATESSDQELLVPHWALPERKSAPSKSADFIFPVEQYHENLQYYSAVKPEPNTKVDGALLHITIELPVYKESLE